jgi:DNA-binding LacI/PurR family transcriptional regulator
MKARRTTRSRATIKDVAARAGFSPSTVTRALRGDSFVRAETRERIERAASELAYRPNILARALVTRVSHTIGVLIPAIGDAFWAAITAGIEAGSAGTGYSMLVASSHDERARELELLETLLTKRVDGLVIGSAAAAPATRLQHLDEQIPTVYVDFDIPFAQELLAVAHTAPIDDVLKRVARAEALGGLVRVAIDDRNPTRAVVDHLLSQGRERIAFVGSAPVRSSLLRVLAFREALQEHRREPAAIVECDRTMAAGYAATRKLLAETTALDAIVAYDDLVATGAMRALHSLGLRVPGDVAVTGFDDIEVAAYLEPPLSTVRQPAREMGTLAAKLLLDQLRGADVAGSHVLEGELVVRGSTIRRA